MADLGGEMSDLYEVIEGRLGKIVNAARERVVAWRWARPSPLPHRREPFLHERLWLPRGEFLDGSPADVGEHERYGFDSDGVVALYLTDGSRLRDGLPDGAWLPPHELPAPYEAGDVVLGGGEDVVVCAAFAEEADGNGPRFLLTGIVRYQFDGRRVASSEYCGWGGDDPQRGLEEYVYDAEGRLVGIEEYAGLGETTHDYGRREDLIDVGGSLSVRDGENPSRTTILAEEGVVWRAAPATWSQLLEERAEASASDCVAAIAAWSERSVVRGERPVLAIQLDDYTQASLGAHLMIAFDDRPPSGEAPAWTDWEGVTNWIAFDDEEGTLLRVGALEDEDVQTAVSEAVARRLLTVAWRGILTLSDDFLVFVDRAENEPGEWAAAARRINAPDAVARWTSRGWLPPLSSQKPSAP